MANIEPTKLPNRLQSAPEKMRVSRKVRMARVLNFAEGVLTYDVLTKQRLRKAKHVGSLTINVQDSTIGTLRAQEIAQVVQNSEAVNKVFVPAAQTLVDWSLRSGTLETVDFISNNGPLTMQLANHLGAARSVEIEQKGDASRPTHYEVWSVRRDN